jgi:hypothetical protein
MTYQEAIQRFNLMLTNDTSVIDTAIYYDKSVAEIVKALQCRLYTKANKKGETIKVWLDFIDVNTNIQFQQTLTL